MAGLVQGGKDGGQKLGHSEEEIHNCQFIKLHA